MHEYLSTWPDFPNGLRILLLDESPQERQETETLLIETNYKVTCCSTAQEAITELTNPSNSFHLVVAEYHALNGETGESLKLLHRLKKSRKSLPFILLSASSNPADVVQGLNQGAAEFLRKPLAPSKARTLYQHTIRNMMSKSNPFDLDRSHDESYSNSLDNPRTSSPEICDLHKSCETCSSDSTSNLADVLAFDIDSRDFGLDSFVDTSASLLDPAPIHHPPIFESSCTDPVMASESPSHNSLPPPASISLPLPSQPQLPFVPPAATSTSFPSSCTSSTPPLQEMSPPPAPCSMPAPQPIAQMQHPMLPMPAMPMWGMPPMPMLPGMMPGCPPFPMMPPFMRPPFMAGMPMPAMGMGAPMMPFPMCPMPMGMNPMNPMNPMNGMNPMMMPPMNMHASFPCHGMMAHVTSLAPPAEVAPSMMMPPPACMPHPAAHQQPQAMPAPAPVSAPMVTAAAEPAPGLKAETALAPLGFQVDASVFSMDDATCESPPLGLQLKKSDSLMDLLTHHLFSGSGSGW